MHEIPVCASFRPLAPSFTSKGTSNNISGVNSLKDMHHPGLLQASVSCTRLFACVERTKVSYSSYSRDPRMRLFPAFSSLAHFERKTKLYSRGKHTQRFASPWPIANFCELHASVCTCGEDQGVKFELFTRSSYTQLFSAFSSLVHFKKKIKY